MFSRPKILFLVSLLFVALLNPKFNPYLLFKFLIFLLILNYFLYKISHPTKYGVAQLDLSDEVNIEAPGSLLHNQLLVERVICKTFNHCKCDVHTYRHTACICTASCIIDFCLLPA